MNQTNVERLLEELLGEIRLLNVNAKADALRKFSNEFLASDLRKSMYAAIDGERSLQQISSDIGCKVNTLQVFAQSLIENDLVEFITSGNARILKKSVYKIALYYANKTLNEGVRDNG